MYLFAGYICFLASSMDSTSWEPPPPVDLPQCGKQKVGETLNGGVVISPFLRLLLMNCKSSFPQRDGKHRRSRRPCTCHVNTLRPSCSHTSGAVAMGTACSSWDRRSHFHVDDKDIWHFHSGVVFYPAHFFPDCTVIPGLLVEGENLLYFRSKHAPKTWKCNEIKETATERPLFFSPVQRWKNISSGEGF